LGEAIFRVRSEFREMQEQFDRGENVVGLDEDPPKGGSDTGGAPLRDAAISGLKAERDEARKRIAELEAAIAVMLFDKIKRVLAEEDR